jgi:hypothetical protein
MKSLGAKLPWWQPRADGVGTPTKKTVLQEEGLRTATKKMPGQHPNEKDGHQRGRYDGQQ